MHVTLSVYIKDRIYKDIHSSLTDLKLAIESNSSTLDYDIHSSNINKVSKSTECEYSCN